MNNELKKGTKTKNNNEPYNNFSLIFTGRLLDGKNPSQVSDSLQKLFNQNSEFIDKLFSKSPLTIKRNIDRNTALRYQMLFAKAGCECIIKHSKQLVQDKEKQERVNSASITTEKSDKSSNEITVDHALAILRGSILPDGNELKTTPLPLSSTELFLRFSITALLSTFIIGLFSGPKKIFGYIAERVEINGQKLCFDNRWAFVIPFTILIGGTYLYTLIFTIIYQHLYTTALKMVIISTEVFLFPFPAGIAVIVFLNMLITSTTLNGFVIGRSLFQNDLSSAFNYINDNARKIYMMGMLFISSLFGGAPFFTAIILREWFDNLEIHGKRYKVNMPWDIIIAGTVFNFLTLGIYIFKLISDIHLKMHKNSAWEDIKQ